MTTQKITTAGLQAESIAAYIRQNADLEMPVTVHDQIHSTSDWCLERRKAFAARPFAAFALEQTKGRGRRGKYWLMKRGDGVALSLCWYYPKSSSLQLLPMAMAVAIARMLEELRLQGLGEVQIKWPNDVFVDDGKIAGVLIDSVISAGDKDTACVIGTGLNIDSSSIAGMLDQQETRYTGLVQQAGSACPGYVEIAQRLLLAMVRCCQRFPESGETALEDYLHRYDYCKNRQVDVTLDDGKQLSGTVIGVDGQARLLLNVDGVTFALDSADVSVRVAS